MVAKEVKTMSRLKELKSNYSGREFITLLPYDATELIDLESDDAIIPYWADQWPSSEVALKFFSNRDLVKDGITLEIGSGVGGVSTKLSTLFNNYIASDYSEDAVNFCIKNRDINGVKLESICFDWNHSPFNRSIDTIIGIDILYEREMIGAVVKFISETLKIGGKAYIFDPQRPFWGDFKESLVKANLKITESSILESKNGATIEIITVET